MPRFRLVKGNDGKYGYSELSPSLSESEMVAAPRHQRWQPSPPVRGPLAAAGRPGGTDRFKFHCDRH